MKKIGLIALILIAASTLSVFSGCILSGKPYADGETENTESTGDAQDGNSNEILEFRPVDVGIQAQREYIYPFIGIDFTPTESLYDKIESREAFVYQTEEFEDATTVKYAFMTFYATTEAQREEKVMSVDIYEWLDNLEKTGAIGIYDKDSVSDLDTLTGCDTHKKVGNSDDGKYEYYLSLNSECTSEISKELEKSPIFITEMREFESNYTYNAFSVGKNENVDSTGIFSEKDVFGNDYNQDIFSDYDLTLVNVLTTWCTYCVEEMPELEKLRADYVKDGVKFNVVAVVLDTKFNGKEDDNAIELAKTLHDKSGASFPFLIPDESEMNGRLTGIESFPESFFVDRDGNIVSEAYIGARSYKEWKTAVDGELEKLGVSK